MTQTQTAEDPTIKDLTIRQLKALGKTTGVPGFSKMVKGDLIEAIRLKVADGPTLQKHVDALLAPEAQASKPNGKPKPKDPTEGMGTEELKQARLDAMLDIAKASGGRMKAEDKLRSVRKELNQDVSESKASFKGAMERSVDYDDPESVSSKLIAVTESYQEWEDQLERRRQELAPLKERLSKCRTRERKAFEDARQLKLKF